jgi:hypothetical protein
MDTSGFAEQRYQNSGYQCVGLTSPDCILSRLGPSCDHVVVDQELRETPGSRAASGRDRNEKVYHAFERSLATTIAGWLKNARKAALSDLAAGGIRKPSQFDRIWNAGAPDGQERLHLCKHIWVAHRALDEVFAQIVHVAAVLINSTAR